MNLGMEMDEHFVASQRPFHHRLPVVHREESADDSMESTFLVSDDEGDDDDEQLRATKMRNSVHIDDYSPIPVRSLTTRDAMVLQKMKTAATTAESRSESDSDLKVGVMLPQRGSQLRRAQPDAALFGGFTLQPRNLNQHALCRFAHMPNTDRDLACSSSNLHGLESKATRSSKPLNPRSKAHESASFSDCYHLQQHHQQSSHDYASPVFATAGAHKTPLGHNLNLDASSSLESASCSSLKRVTFLSSSTCDTSAAHTMKSVSFASSRPLSRRPMARSQSIAIVQKRGSGRSTSTPLASNGLEDQESFAQLSESYSERLYDSATWRMYHRIVDHRRHQLQQRQTQQDALGEDAVDPSRTLIGHGHSMMMTSQYHHHHHDHSVQDPSMNASSTSSVSSSHLEEVEIFEMEL